MTDPTFTPLPCPGFCDHLPGSGTVWIGFSGGPDSLCLAALLAEQPINRPLVAVHVDHGLDRQSAERAQKAERLAGDLGLTCRVLKVNVAAGKGPEAAAREARYAAFEALLSPDETLLVAHHADDQAETVLLRLMRGAGPAGLAGMPSARRLGPGWLARPLLAWRRNEILAFLEQRNLNGIADPSNDSLAFDRNFIRHQILPLLESRWPAARNSLLKTAELCAGSARALHQQSDAILASQDHNPMRLRLDKRLLADRFRLGLQIRHWLGKHLADAPPGPRFEEFLRQLQTAGPDRQPEIRWQNWQLRRYRDELWLDKADRQDEAHWCLQWSGDTRLILPNATGILEFISIGGKPLPSPIWPGEPLQVRSGQPGEALAVRADKRPVPVTQLLHDLGVPPWQRRYWPRLWQQDRLLAVGANLLDHELAAQCTAAGVRLHWETSLFHTAENPSP